VDCNIFEFHNLGNQVGENSLTEIIDPWQWEDRTFRRGSQVLDQRTLLCIGEVFGGFPGSGFSLCYSFQANHHIQRPSLSRSAPQERGYPVEALYP
jgi:hypothetical protein